jgi:two-component system, chemotaxis family, CheB/CheR fusion protein
MTHPTQIQSVVDVRVQALNDLLQTVSVRLLVRIKELDRTNGDLQNLIAVTAIPAIFVDENLLVRGFTPEIARIYNLTSRNIGRSLLSVSCILDYHDLEEDLGRVTAEGTTVERYLERQDNKALYLMRILPNRCRDGSIGATLTLVKVNAWSRGRA